MPPPPQTSPAAATIALRDLPRRPIAELNVNPLRFNAYTSLCPFLPRPCLPSSPWAVCALSSLCRPGPVRSHLSSPSSALVAPGGGYSIYFSRPDFQNVLTAANSSYVGSSPGAPGPNSNMRGVPDVSYNASSRTGVLVYDTESLSNNQAGTTCGGANPCQAGWYTVGGTSASSPQWAGLTALADVQAGHDLGFINPALYRVFAGPNYHSDFYDPHVNTNQQSAIPGWLSTDGWDAVTGIGTPNAAKLIPDLIAAVLPGG